MIRDDLAKMRRDYASTELHEENAAKDPLDQFRSWVSDAIQAEVLDPNAMTLATCGDDRRPSVRVVLLKYYGDEGFTFFTNYTSKKGRELDQNPNAALHFFWPELHRQILIQGQVTNFDKAAGDEYFLSRPLDSKIGAWTSHQSAEVASRKVLDDRFAELQKKFGDDVPPPPFWGGYTLRPDCYEFWQGRVSRLHDRLVYLRTDDDWSIKRLAP
ncbi:MAG: pyridoxamine 5'-phosphate oxidase [Acidobacteria bacterium]|nr:pyridoxamine 5'-phosphate oxidase [Acidobacteriota bacterium]